MVGIPFTQYMRPNGRAMPVTIDMPDEVAAKGHEIIESGLELECEVLSNGRVSFTITHPDDGDLDIRVCENGPNVPHHVADLILNFALTPPPPTDGE